MARVFISYTHRPPDEKLAQDLAGALSGRHQVFIDTNIKGGQVWGDVIDQELHTADFLLPLLSANSVASPMVVAEIAMAHQFNVANGRPGIVPIRLDSTPLKYPLIAYVNRFQAISWTGPQDTSKLTRNALAALEQQIELKPGVLEQPPERNQLIQRVRADWIDGILRKSLHGVSPIQPVVQADPHAIEHRVDAIIQRAYEQPVPMPPGTSPSSVFDDHLGQLLILGAPGSGKTTLLLEIADALIKRADHDSSEPIPVVFNLSSWAERRYPLERWLAEELQLRSDCPRQLARRLVKGDQLTLLLDGLDEVASEHRNACVDAINKYRAEHGFVKILVTSRVEEYDALTLKLRLPAAILILPLSQSQILQYLSEAGDSLNMENVSQTIQADPALLSLLETPLMLGIVALAGQQLFAVDAGPRGSRDLQQQKLFGYYTDAMFKRRTKERRYTPEEMRHWLSWLARTLSTRQKTLFRIEELRFHWLEAWYERLGVVAAIALAVGLGSALLGDIFMTAFITAAFHLSDFGETAIDVVRAFSPYFFIIGIVVALVRGRTRRPVDVLEMRWPGFVRAAIAAVEGGVLGAILGFFSAYVGCRFYANGSDSNPISVLLYTIMCAVAFGCGFVVSAFARPRDLETHPSTDFSLRQSLRYTLTYMGACLGVGIVSLLFLAGMGLTKAGDSVSPVTALVGAVAFLGWVGFFSGMEKGGYFLLDHYLTRAFLWKRNRMPWDYLRFLETASERVFLRQIGSGYMFVHRMLLDYFAGQWNAVREATQGSASPQDVQSINATTGS
jgi:hypothetical protein